MLKGIPRIILPELMKVLMEMGHGDEIVIADGNFPALTCARRLVRYAGCNIPELLDAVLGFLPLDTYVEHPVALMAIVQRDKVKPAIWDEYKKIVQNYDKRVKHFEFIDRSAFYERAKNAYAIVATSETALYANIILKKGIVK